MGEGQDGQHHHRGHQDPRLAARPGVARCPVPSLAVRFAPFARRALPRAVPDAVDTRQHGLHLVGQQELAGRLCLLLADVDVDGPVDGVRAVNRRTQLGEDPLGAEPGDHDPRVERPLHAGQVDHSRGAHV